MSARVGTTALRLALDTGRHLPSVVAEYEERGEAEYFSWQPREVREPGNVEFESWGKP